jgi:L-fuconate dehydratase
MNSQPDYSAAYVVLRTSGGDEGHSLVFTIGRGTEVQDAAVRSYAPFVVGLAVEDALQDPGAFSRRPGGDSPMRRLSAGERERVLANNAERVHGLTRV